MSIPASIRGLLDHPRVVAGATESSDTVHVSYSPTTGEPIAGVKLDTPESYERAISDAVGAFKKWRAVPGPVRGRVVRAIGDALREHKGALGELVSLEVGKIRSEGEGEVQETIDIADFAVGLSRQLYGLTMPSERPGHAMREQWLPLGPIGVITAFNFPNAVWGWNAMLAAVCGDTVLWKPSMLAPLTAVATHAVCERVAREHGHPGVFQLLLGGRKVVGDRMIHDKRIPLVSATGSCRMGRQVGAAVAERLARSLLELGGNNAVIVEPDADLDLALKSVLFGAVGTTGQRCTSTRRLIIHESVADKFVADLAAAYKMLKIGDPLQKGVLVGPLITEGAVGDFEAAIKAARGQGGEIVVGGSRLAPAKTTPPGLGGHFVEPTIVRAPASNKLPIAADETFAPILYVFTYKTFDEAMAIQNGVDQGLSSSIMTGSVGSAERFLNPDGSGSDCGLAYVNLGTSGAEIGGAFGGEKDTGGGRESGSDSWKAYMRRQTCTINFGGGFVLAQDIEFGGGS